ncbi:hypothetical protein [Kineococcus sp. SYSU DK005]|uniref:hypothetical protein n=1 Tax=Kineococcus sp. SYSU DK005 TaxID=3383126 RepID=UPI003D7EDCCF
MVDELDLPTPYAQDTWLETVSRRLGHPIYCSQMPPKLLRLLRLVHSERITGLTLTYRDGWLILLSADLDDLRRHVVLGRELERICSGEVPAGDDPETNTDVSQGLFTLLGLVESTQGDRQRAGTTTSATNSASNAQGGR